MTANSAAMPTPRDVCRMVFRHKLKILSCFVLTMSAVAAVIVFWPRDYRSEAKLLVRVGRESVALDPTATTGQVIPLMTPRELEINSVLEMLRSRVMVEKVVDAIGPERILRQSTTPLNLAAEPGWTLPKWLQWNAWIAAVPRLDPISSREKAINLVARRLDSSVQKQSNIITVSSKAQSPQLAQEIATTLVDIYLSEHARHNRTAGSHAFFTEQTALLAEKLTGDLEALRDAKNDIGLVSVVSQQKILQDETITVETELARARAALAAANGKVQVLRRTVAALPGRVMTEEVQGHPNQASDQMRNTLYELEIREAELASKFTDDYPLLAAIRQQIKLAKTTWDQQDPQRTQSKTTVNTVQQQLQLSLLSEESQVGSLAAQVQVLEEQYAVLQNRGRRLNEHEVQIAQLQRNVELAEANYKTYAEKLEQGRIDDALKNERITNVNVVQPASYVAKPVSPKKLAVFVLGLVGAILMALGVALLAERLDPSLKTPAEVEERLALPVLVSIPWVPQRHVLLN